MIEQFFFWTVLPAVVVGFLANANGEANGKQIGWKERGERDHGVDANKFIEATRNVLDHFDARMEKGVQEHSYSMPALAWATMRLRDIDKKIKTEGK